MKPLLEQLSRKISLRNLLIIPFLLQLSAAVGLTGYFAFRNGQASVTRLASQLRHEMSSRIEAELNIYLERPYQFNHLNAASLAQGQLDMQNGSNAVQFLRQVQLSPFIYASYCGDESGQYLGAYRAEEGNNVSTFGLSVSNAASDYNLALYNIDAYGNQQALTTVTKPYDPRQRPWYRSAVEAGTATWGQVYLDFATGLPIITASEPVYASGDRLVGVCAIDVVLLQDFRQFLANLSIGRTGKAFVMDRTGALISSSTDEPITEQEGEDLKLIQAIDSSEPLIRETAQYLTSQFDNFTELTQPQQLDFTLNRERQFVEVLPLQNDRGLDWLIVLVVPESDFMSQIHASARTTLWLCLLTLGATTLSGVLIARWVSRPISQLGRASQMIAQDLDYRVDIHGIEEIETLGQSFNQMAGQLRESFTALEQINQTLEARVEERTIELKEANAEISLLNEQLQEDNLRMRAELNVARQLQQMILPREQELSQISEFDIAGFMEVASEVGGDYYDVIYRKDGVLIGIGDVTGHGLESGVLMIMVQTAIRALAAANYANPATFLNAVNQAIYQNAQRMSPGKNLTLALLDYRDKQLWLTGQHEEVLVVRAAGAIERVDTIDLGFPLGMVDDITEFVGQIPIDLNPGDGIVLYTDGVIEAENSQRQLYGLDRLMEMIQQHWKHPAIEIRQAIITDVQQHIGDRAVLDDITLVVLKKVEEMAMVK